MLWAELEKRFRELEPSLQHARLDHENGHDGERWRVGACMDYGARSRFESLSEIAGRKLAASIPPHQLPEILRDAASNEIRWYRFLARDMYFYKPNEPLTFYDDSNEVVGWSHGGSVSNPAAAAAALCLRMMAMTSESEDEKPNSSFIANFYGDQARLNMQSVDNSNNVVNSGDMRVFADVQKVILEYVSKDRQTEILAQLDDMRSAANTPSYSNLYKDFMGSLADHITIVPALAAAVAPYIPMLAAFIQRG